jgi:hypothetical protein
LLAGISKDPEDPEPAHELRALPPPPTTVETPVAPTPTQKDTDLIKLFASAMSLHHACTPLDKLKKSLGHAIGKRMVQRQGEFIWQTATYTVENVPLSAVEQLLPQQLRVEGRAPMWVANTLPEIVAMMEPLLSKSGFICAGVTRALMTPSERVCRVVATVIPAPDFQTAFFVRSGSDFQSFKFQYVLADEHGEVHPPKDGNRNEMELAPELEAAVRQQILADLLTMADAGAPLGPGFLRQLGRLDQAAVLEAQLQNQSELELQPPPPPPLPPPDDSQLVEKVKRRRLQRGKFAIECILGKRPATRVTEAVYLVRWAGYHESWEAWRLDGDVGDPVSTWEPESYLEETEALQDWKEQQAQP